MSAEQEGKAFIEHYGVKGMKWGVRRDRSQLRSARRDRERTRFEKSPKRLTNSQLEARIKRMDNEKRYNQLNSRDVSAGEAFVVDILNKSGKTTAITIVSAAGLMAAKIAIEKKFGKETLDNMFPKKKK